MQKIRIQNLGPIQDVTIELKPITILLGEQATGKSTIAQCVYFFRSLTEDLTEEIFRLRRGSTIEQIESVVKNTIRSKFYIYYGGSRFLDDFDVIFYYSENSYIRILKGAETTVEFSSGLGIGELCHAIYQHFDITFLSAASRAEALQNIIESHLLNLPPNFSARFERDVYYQADRNIATMYSEQFRQIFLDSYRTSSLLTGRNIPRSVHLELMREFVERIVTMKEIFDRSGGNFESLLVDGRIRRPLIDDFLDRCSNILKGRYIIASGGIEKIRISSGRHIELGRASSGQQSVIRLLQELAILIAQNRYTYRTIEEPEAHLFPAAQYHLTELMLMCHNLTQSEFLLTTHSPYFVATFNNALYASKAAQFDNSEVTNIGYPPHLRLNPDNFAAYQVQNGRATSIYQSDEALTSIDGLDAVSYDIGQKFSRLAEIVQLNEVLSV